MFADREVFPVRDIDEAEIETLLEQRELLAATELIAQTGHCQWDYNNSRLISCSQGYARIFNMSIADLMEGGYGRDKILAQIHPDDRQAYLDSYDSLHNAGNYAVEYRFIRNDGEVRSLREVATSKFDEKGDTSEIFAIIQDVTERVARQRHLEDQQELVRQVEAITDIGYFINDEEIDKFLYLSPGYVRIHGMSVEEFMRQAESTGDNLFAVHADDRERLLSEIASYIENGDDNFVSEYRIVRPDGEVIWVRERSKSRLKKNGRVTLTLAVIQDITEKRSYEQNLQEAKDSLETTVAERTQQLADTVSQLQQEIGERVVISTELESKNAELERFAYTVSHDLKTPLVTIKGFLGLLEKDLANNDLPAIARDMENVNRGADTMAQLLEDLLELSRVGRVVGDLATCSLTTIAKQAAQMADARVVELGAEVTIEEMPEQRVDRLRFAEVYQNLIENALKFMGDQQSPRIHIGATERDGKSCHFVRDNGIGIAARYHELIFGLFERLSMDVEGTGVGLTLVKRIIEVHGGKVWVESEGPGYGTTVFFTLPES